jgi:predicted nuclease with TOPRIM domain
MEVKDYCKYVGVELTTWKAKMYDLMNKIDKLSSGEKQRMLDEINGLNIIITELDDRIDKLRTECPVAWKPEQEQIQSKFSEINEKYKETKGVLFDYDFGG